MDQIEAIPTVDLEKVQIILPENEINSEILKNVGKEMASALIKFGFFYVVNHGIPINQISACSEASKRFFDLPDGIKLNRLRNMDKCISGYSPIPGVHGEDMPNERFDLLKPADHKEALNVCHLCDPSIWPNQELPELKETTMAIIEHGQALVTRLLLLIGYGLTPDNPRCFQDGFKECGTEGNISQVKLVHYPKASEVQIEQGGLRCGEHTDWGLLTLLFLDSTPGLQVFTRKGTYVDVEFKENAVLVNIGDLFQRWTSDVLHSAKHRVIFRPDTISHDRYSLVYFSAPDKEAIIGPVMEPKDKYPPIRAIDYHYRRVKGAFAEGEGIDRELNFDY